MSEAWAEALESEAYESTGEAAYETESTGEAAYETESTGEAAYEGLGEDARSDRRARQRQIMLARQRQAQLRRPSRPPVPVPQRGVIRPPSPGPAITATIRNLDLEAKVAQDSLRRALKQANDRAERANLATVAATAASQIFDSFENDLAAHNIVRAGIRGAPLLLLSPAKQRGGIEKYALDPRVIGAALIAVIAGAGKFRSSPKGVHDIKISVPVPLGGSGNLLAVAVDRNGNVVADTITWTSQNPEFLTVDPSTGVFKAISVGTAVVKATAGGFTSSVFVPVTQADLYDSQPS
jgi:hypothetical protein